MDWNATRPNEIGGAPTDRADATVIFIGRIRTPFRSRDECPRQGGLDGPLCRIEIDEPWRLALKGLEAYPRLEVIYWMHLARRDLLVQAPRTDGEPRGAFALRSPVRPNPIATSIVEVEAIEDGAMLVRGLDCVDGTPLLDIKPRREDLLPAPPTILLA
jgi:tRNA (adenine37-N6)-methyltransferase